MAGRLLTPEPRPPCMHQQKDISSHIELRSTPQERLQKAVRAAFCTSMQALAAVTLCNRWCSSFQLLLTSALEVPRAPRPFSPRLSPELVRGALLPPRPASTGTPPEAARSAPAAHAVLDHLYPPCTDSRPPHDNRSCSYRLGQNKDLLGWALSPVCRALRRRCRWPPAAALEYNLQHLQCCLQSFVHTVLFKAPNHADRTQHRCR